jgi:hypothetical protein
LLLDTGGGLLKARKFLEGGDDEPFLVHNADILTDYRPQGNVRLCQAERYPINHSREAPCHTTVPAV